jgi:hypothetical protein
VRKSTGTLWPNRSATPQWSEGPPKLERDGDLSPSSKSTQRPLRSTASVIVPAACAPVIAPGGSPVVAAIDPTPPPAIILRILGGNAVELFRIYFGAFRTFRTTSTLRRRSFRRGGPSDHKASCRRETTDQAEQECTSFHKLFSIAPRCGSLLDLGEQLVREKLALRYRSGAEARVHVSPSGALVRKATPHANGATFWTGSPRPEYRKCVCSFSTQTFTRNRTHQLWCA